MTQSLSDTIELTRAREGHELWAAVEAAQYARLIKYDEPRSEDEVTRLRELVAYFADCAEHWEDRSASDQTLALERLGRHVAALAEVKLFVYWAVTQGRFEGEDGAPVELPVAVLLIARTARASLTIDRTAVDGLD